MRNIWIQFYFYHLQPFLAWRASQGSQPYQQWECLQCHHRLGPITINYPHLLLGTKMKKNAERVVDLATKSDSKQ